jgi:hypothetical protein
MKQRFHYFTAVLLLFLSGCLGYHIETGRPEKVQSVYIEPILNQTDEPAIEIQMMHALQQRAQFDGRIKLVDRPEDADALLQVRLTDYRLHATAYNNDIETMPEQYRLRIEARSTLSRPDSGEVISRSDTYGEATFFFKSDLTTSKRNALPTATDELARFIYDDLIDQWK